MSREGSPRPDQSPLFRRSAPPEPTQAGLVHGVAPLESRTRPGFFGPVALTRAVSPTMQARGSGHVVVISSLLGELGMRGRSGYAASKHALHGYFEPLQAEVRSIGIAVTLVRPGYIDTDLPLRALTGDGRSQGQRDGTHPRGMSPSACAARILESIERRREEVVIGGWETYAVSLKRLFPRLFARAISAYAPT